MFKIGIQTNAWSDELHRNCLPQILEEIAAAGYQGIEIGAHRVDVDAKHPEKPGAFRQLIEGCGLVVAGLHTHGALFEAEEVKAACERVEKAAAFAAAVGAPYVLFSGKPKPGKTPAELVQEAAALQQAGQVASRQGAQFLYHNHYWEVEHDYAELRNLMEHTDPQVVSFALDVGWVHRAGGRPAEAAHRFISRVAYFHFKDFRVKDFQHDTWTELGTGYVDFPGVVAAIQGKDLWITYERDETLANAAESAKISREYLRSLLGY